MGYALAAAAWRRGAEVLLVSGPTELAPPPGPRLLRVESAEEMLRAVDEALPDADVLMMAAAVADFRPARAAGEKIKKGDRPDSIELESVPDILLDTRLRRRPRSVIVGFALETSDAEANARGKLEAKGLDLVVLNRADEEGAGFNVATNRVTLISRDGEPEAVPMQSKLEVADVIIDRVEQLIAAR
jgi:phosphopantothenoylcysteine decarboxylase/phosphopantothenate--cysteine ligase